MKYAILGAGAMGSLIGAHFAKGGAEVILIDPYEAHMNVIASDGLTMTVNGTPEVLRMKAVTAPEEVGICDVVIVLVKGLHTVNALKGARNLFGEKTYALTLQNGIGTEDNLLTALPAEKILKGVMHITSKLTAPGAIESMINYERANVHIGSYCPSSEANDTAQAVVADLCAGGLNAVFDQEIEEAIWAKAVNNISANAACGIVRLPLGIYCTHKDGRFLLETCIKEVISVAEAHGVKNLDFERVIRFIEEHTIPKFGTHLPSTAQDMKAKRKTEIDSLNGAISRLGDRYGIATPVNDVIAAMTHLIEDNYDKQF